MIHHLFQLWFLWLFFLVYFVSDINTSAHGSNINLNCNKTTSCWQIKWALAPFRIYAELRCIILFVYPFLLLKYIPVFVFSVRSCWNIYLCRDQYLLNLDDCLFVKKVIDVCSYMDLKKYNFLLLDCRKLQNSLSYDVILVWGLTYHQAVIQCPANRKDLFFFKYIEHNIVMLIWGWITYLENWPWHLIS